MNAPIVAPSLTSNELVIYCDESLGKGKFYSNFYGGALVASKNLPVVEQIISEKMSELNLLGECKWSKITHNYMDKYLSLMDCLFDLLEKDLLKIRIMFTQNIYVAKGLTHEQKEQEFFILYYQFIKLAFGLEHCNIGGKEVNIRLLLDDLPDTKEKCSKFKGYIRALERSKGFMRSNLKIKEDHISEVHSHEHVILQCLDVVLGSMQFRLNDKHKEKPDGQRKRGKRTVAKEKVYKHINKRIRGIYPGFNIGASTSSHGDTRNYWQHPYRHWIFIPSSYEVSGSGKRKS